MSSPNTSGETWNYYPYPAQYVVGHSSTVGMDAAGNFAVGWLDDTSAPSSNERLRVQAYTAAGAARGDPTTLIETRSADSFGRYALAMDADGDLVLAWD